MIDVSKGNVLSIVCSKIQVAQGRKRAHPDAAITALELEEYLEALKVLPAVAWEQMSWENFLRSIKQSPQANQEYLLMIWPCDLNGTSWTDTELKNGQHFQCVSVLKDSRETASGEHFLQVLPNELWDTSVIHLESNETIDQFIEKLEKLYAKFMTMIRLK